MVRRKTARLLPQFEITHRDTYDKLEDYVTDAEVLFTLSLRPDQFQVAKKLKWVHCPAAAVRFSFPEFVNSGVILTNDRDVHGPVVAEHVMALVPPWLKISTCAPATSKSASGDKPVWYANPHPRLIAGATLGLVGLGSIGRAVAKHASDLNAVIATRGNPEKGATEGVAQVFPSSQLDQCSRSRAMWFSQLSHGEHRKPDWRKTIAADEARRLHH
jgi:phosphoglycerate dehydrogenase-like enzyme